ncbi:hypothetical protein UYO_0551 [Lachnospiraceae bacterium JC7]|nr:hypothetical protein UYO_0551 [Lachnospiraceae bacterium JC7]
MKHSYIIFPVTAKERDILNLTQKRKGKFMRRKFKKTVTMLASLTISVAQIQTPAMAGETPEKKTIEANQTVEDNSSVIEKNNGTVKNNNKDGIIESNNNLVENNNKGGVIKKNTGTVNNNKQDAQVKENTGTIKTNEGIVGNEGPGNTVNYGIIEDNQADIYLNAGTKDGEDLDISDYSGATIDSNSAVISVNNGTINTNEENGEVLENNGQVNTNNGLIDTNNSIVSTNENTINYNGGSVTENTQSGYIEVNGEDAYIGTNYGEIGENQEGGKVGLNTGYIHENDGDVGYVEDIAPDESSGPGSESRQVVDEYTGNYGIITENTGTITYNAGINDKEKLLESDVQPEIIDEFKGGIVEVNEGLIIVNNGTVEANSGTVKTNEKSGIVSNYESGVVEKNNGTVFNYGGTVKDKSTGTEYFSINVSIGKNTKKSGEDNLKKHEDDLWLGQQGEKKTSTEITITPSSGYYITGISVPEDMSKNVSVKENPDGTWTITVTSGTNIMLSIPDALYRNSGNDSGDDDNDGGDNNNSGPGNNGNVLINIQNIVGQPIGSNNNQINVDMSKVFKSLKDKYAAVNSFKNAPAGIDLNNIQGFGEILLSALFENSTEESIFVPVSANVSAGQTYTIYYSDNTSKDVKCLQNGQILIPFTKGTAAITFLIYGTASTPSTGNEQTETNKVQYTSDFSVEGTALRNESQQYTKAISQLPSNVQAGEDRSRLNKDTETITGDYGADTLLGGYGDDTLLGASGGNDTLMAGAGNDAFYLGLSDGNDTILGFTSSVESNDELFFLGSDKTKIEKTGDLTLELDDSGRYFNRGKDSINLDDKVVWLDGSAGVTYNSLNASKVSSDEPILAGSSHTESIVGGRGANSLWGGSGAAGDTLAGHNSADSAFYFSQGDGKDINIFDKGDDKDIITFNKGDDKASLLDFSKGEINLASVKNNSVNISLADGSKLTITHAFNPASFKTDGGDTFILNDNREWKKEY